MFLKTCRLRNVDPTAYFFELAARLYNPLRPADEDIDGRGTGLENEDEDEPDDGELAALQ